ncbi:hypothetical protein MNB_SV-13-138 [hydrothermal vent metagenome]|uniref:Caspase family p20 domain-containing protein n=1 Tax=hydrothermal vent metagenome TaxID=652676 RepID=A0A1W1D0K7_9ZZZZ
MYKIVTMLIVGLLFGSCANSPATRGSGSSPSYATRDVEVVFGEEQTYPRIALVIGNNNYQKNKKLTNAVPDARAMRNFLENRGFKVVYAEDADKNTMTNRVNEFMGGLGKKSVAVIYYAGHASQDKSRKTGMTTNYLVPINDSSLTSVTDYDRDAISMNYILNKADELNHGINIAMLDACRTPIGRGGNIQNIGAEGVYLVYSTASGTTASDSGAFRRSFLKYAEKAMKLTDIFEKVKLDLRKEGQRPSVQNDKVGSFYFTQAIKPTPMPVVKPQTVDRVVYRDRPQAVSTPQSKWITPTKSVCESNGGEISKYGCRAKWEDAKKICRVSGGVLPTEEILGQVVRDCGGSLATYGSKDFVSLIKKNIANKSYQSCYKKKGFQSAYCWSLTSISYNIKDAWIVNFYSGVLHNGVKGNNAFVRCVRAGQ